MNEPPDSLVIEILRRIQGDLRELRLDVQDIKHHLSGIEVHLGELASGQAGQSVRLDRHDERLGRIERRLELTEPSP